MIFASTILMVRPASFAFNEQTAADNSFQQRLSFTDLTKKVLTEFDNMVMALRSAGIRVIVIDDTTHPVKPDAIFPNNWFCTLPDGTLATFPMLAANRRTERRPDIINKLIHEFTVTELEDWTSYEQHQSFLEGTGSMVIDHNSKIIYACISDRTDPLLVTKFGERVGYDVVSFVAKDPGGSGIYHTNVMMCIGNGFCIACDEVIARKDIETFRASLTRSGMNLISISFEQVKQFAGNMLQLQNTNGDHILVMSRTAYEHLLPDQIAAMQTHTRLLPVDVATIEAIGGGSARCMMAEIFLSSK